MASNDEVKISLSDLEKIVKAIFENIRTSTGNDEVSLKVDYYKDIPLKEIYSEINAAQSNIVYGQLYEDWEFSKRILTHSDEAFPLMLDHVAPLLRYIAFHFLPKEPCEND